MPQKQNPTANGSRVLWKSLDGASIEPPTPLDVQAQFLIAAHRGRPEVAAMVATLVFGGHGNG